MLIAGVDEVGRGPLAGPVMAAAVILPPNFSIRGLTDSKLLTAEKRNQLYEQINEQALAWAVGRAEVIEIDTINILQASLLAMQRAVAALSLIPDEALVDGNICPKLSCKVSAIVQGDKLIPAISAASIMAKVTRDREMVVLDATYPGYGLAQHKGYSTKEHLRCLRLLGPSPIHRFSFAPVREAKDDHCNSLMTASFIHLNLHTEYSLVDGMVRLDPLIEACVKYKMPAVAITDRTNYFAAVKFYKEAIANGVKPILGTEVLFANEADPQKPFAMILLCQNEIGYKNGMALISRAYCEGQK